MCFNFKSSIVSKEDEDMFRNSVDKLSFGDTCLYKANSMGEYVKNKVWVDIINNTFFVAKELALDISECSTEKNCAYISNIPFVLEDYAQGKVVEVDILREIKAVLTNYTDKWVDAEKVKALTVDNLLFMDVYYGNVCRVANTIINVVDALEKGFSCEGKIIREEVKKQIGEKDCAYIFLAIPTVSNRTISELLKMSDKYVHIGCYWAIRGVC